MYEAYIFQIKIVSIEYKNKIKKDRNMISSFYGWPLDQAQCQKAVKFSTTSLDNL